jgi:UDP-galactopyranose mutase
MTMPTALGAVNLAFTVTLTDDEDEALSEAQSFSYKLKDDDGLLNEQEIREIGDKIKAAYVAGDADPVE